ncbi:MAG: SRPBCC family protein [Bacteroidetes bacterium]|nr:SRPBCC family protein [Bacteroidota bacterium]
MKVLKKILLVLLVLIVVAAVIGWMMPSQLHVERSLTMNAPVENIYDQVNTLKNWEGWSPWQKMDPEVKITYNTIPAGEGASYSWNGPKTGEGTITLTECKPTELIKMDLAFKGEKPASSYFTFAPDGSGTNVTWAFDSELGANPFVRLFWSLGKSMMTDAFDQGLAGISEMAGKAPVASTPSIPVELKAMPAMEYLFIHDSASIATIGMKLGMNYGKIMEAMKKQGLEQSGAPFAIYYTESTTNWEMDVCIPVNKAGKEDGAIKAGNYAGGNMIVASHYGPYENTPSAHEAAGKFLEKNNKKSTGAPWERYITDPMMEKDSTKWLTEVCYPVE